MLGSLAVCGGTEGRSHSTTRVRPRMPLTMACQLFNEWLWTATQY